MCTHPFNFSGPSCVHCLDVVSLYRLTCRLSRFSQSHAWLSPWYTILEEGLPGSKVLSDAAQGRPERLRKATSVSLRLHSTGLGFLGGGFFARIRSGLLSLGKAVWPSPPLLV